MPNVFDCFIECENCSTTILANDYRFSFVCESCSVNYVTPVNGTDGSYHHIDSLRFDKETDEYYIEG
jgi:hypothetical protein